MAGIDVRTTPPLQPRPPAVPPPKIQKEVEPVGNVFYASMVNKVDKKASLSNGVQKEPKKSYVASDDDWSNLSFNVLKRKSVTEIMSYLKAKGASITGDDGRPMKKAELLEAIFSFSV